MTTAVSGWIARLLGIETGPGEGTVWSLEHQWNWPPWVTLLFVLAAAALVVATYLRENRDAPAALRMLLALLRLGLLAIAMVMVAQVALSFSRTGLPYLAVLLDDSLSMTIVDRYDDKLRSALRKRLQGCGFADASRWNLARTLLTESDGRLLRALEKHYKLRLYYLTGPRASQATTAATLVAEIKAQEPAGETSPLGAAVRSILDDLRGSVPAAILLLTDGITTDGPDLGEAAALARRRGVPLFAVGLGDQQPARDLKLTDLVVEEVVFLNDVVSFEVHLAGTGLAGREARVVLRRADKPGVLAERKVKVGADGQSQLLRIPYRPTEEGQFTYVVEVEPLPGELDTSNNRQQRSVRVRKERIRVLLVQGSPSYEYRYLRNMLQRDPTIELNTILQEADVEHAEQGSGMLRGFPVRREELFAYDVIVLGDFDPSLLSAAMLESLVEFVDQPGKGGSLVALAGPRFMPSAFRNTPLARLLPFNVNTIRYPDPNEDLSEGFVVQPTDLGLASPAMQLGDSPAESAAAWQSLAPLYWFVEIPDLKPAVRVLAEHPHRLGPAGQRLPVIMMQYVGAGKVLFHATDETWRWRYRVGDMFFARYWIQTLRFLARSKLADGGGFALLATDRREYRRGEPVLLRARFLDERLAPAEDDGVTAVLEHPNRKAQRVKLVRSAPSRGLFEARLTQLPIGSYHAWMAIPAPRGRTPAVDFAVVAPPGEFQKIEMDAAELQRAADATKGRFYTFATADRMLDELPEGRQVPIESLPPKPLWNTWPALLLFLVLLSGEWILRKVAGMV